MLRPLTIMATPVTSSSSLLLIHLLFISSVFAFSSINVLPSLRDGPTLIAMASGDIDDKDALLTTIPIDCYQNVELPSAFAYPHFYEPHPIAKYACDQVREQIETLAAEEWAQHNFFRQSHEGNGVGKMFGVLVVRTDNGSLGYLKAYSGSITGVIHPEQYVFVRACSIPLNHVRGQDSCIWQRRQN